MGRKYHLPDGSFVMLFTCIQSLSVPGMPGVFLLILSFSLSDTKIDQLVQVWERPDFFFFFECIFWVSNFQEEQNIGKYERYHLII